jgi:hypothetical protein
MLTYADAVTIYTYIHTHTHTVLTHYLGVYHSMMQDEITLTNLRCYELI